MENAIQIFNNPQFGDLRVIEINNQAWLVASEITNILGYANGRKAISDHVDEDDKLTERIVTSGQNREVILINESGFYALVLRSNLPKAKEFRKWVTSEVLPSIRKNGGYLASKAGESAEDLIARALLLAKEQIDRQTQTILEQAPKVLFADAVATSDRSCLVAELAKIVSQNGYQIGQNRLFEWMRNTGYLCKNGEYYNQPTQRAMEMGLFEIKKTAITKPDGTVLVTVTSKVTGKGQIYFVNKFAKKLQPAKI